MILEMKVPSPGESISEVEIAEWLVKDGDFVEKDQTIAEVDSDKATLDLPAEESGVITLKAEEGDAVAVGQVVCLIDTDAKAPKAKKEKEKREFEKMKVLFEAMKNNELDVLSLSTDDDEEKVDDNRLKMTRKKKKPTQTLPESKV